MFSDIRSLFFTCSVVSNAYLFCVSTAGLGLGLGLEGAGLDYNTGVRCGVSIYVAAFSAGKLQYPLLDDRAGSLPVEREKHAWGFLRRSDIAARRSDAVPSSCMQ